MPVFEGREGIVSMECRSRVYDEGPIELVDAPRLMNVAVKDNLRLQSQDEISKNTTSSMISP